MRLRQKEIEMGYEYEKERPSVFTDEGQRKFLKIRDRAFSLCKTAGVARMEEIISGSLGDSWQLLACVDRLVEIGDLREIQQVGYVAGQHRIFRR